MSVFLRVAQVCLRPGWLWDCAALGRRSSVRGLGQLGSTHLGVHRALTLSGTPCKPCLRARESLVLGVITAPFLPFFFTLPSSPTGPDLTTDHRGEAGEGEAPPCQQLSR